MRRRSEKKTRELSYTSHHEAAHAVVTVLLGLDLTTSTVSPDGSAGETRGPDFTDPRVPMSRLQIPAARTVDRGIIALCAGYHGSRLAGEPETAARLGASTDHHRAGQLAPHATASLEELDVRAGQHVANHAALIRRVARRLEEQGQVTRADVIDLAHDLPIKKGTRP